MYEPFPVSEELEQLIKEAMLRIDIITNGVPELKAEFQQGSDARKDDLPLDPNQTTSWRGGWMTTDLEYAGGNAYLAGNPFDQSQTVFWRMGYLGQKNLEDQLR
jgi:hypothetical protein